MTDKTGKRIAILGSTGSIGKQALEVIEEHPDLFQAEILTANNNADLLIQQALKFMPDSVVIGNESQYEKVRDALQPKDIKVFAGDKALEQIVSSDNIDLVLTALVGYSGLKPTLAAIRAGKNIALANKETLVVAGEIINEEVMRNRVQIIPVDSEHSAIFQCLTGEFDNPVERIILTASGGPFRGKDRNYLETVTREQALKHPNWSMGAKITIDSATMMNKGLEVIEAKWLFDLKKEQIEVIIHPQSVIHSMVQFCDGSIKAQMGLPDMKLPIQYALAYPERISNSFPRFDFASYPLLSFEKPDTLSFRNLALAYEVLEKGGNAPCVLNAANEVAVQAFLDGNTSFLGITRVIENCLDQIPYIARPNLDDLILTNKETRVKAQDLIKKQAGKAILTEKEI